MTKLYTDIEAAKLLGVHFTTLRGFRQNGDGPKFKKIGRLVRYTEADINEYIESRTFSKSDEFKSLKSD